MEEILKESMRMTGHNVDLNEDSRSGNNSPSADPFSFMDSNFTVSVQISKENMNNPLYANYQAPSHLPVLAPS